MKNIDLFIRRFFNSICFVLLQICCIVMLSKFSKTHEAFFGSAFNEATGIINQQYAYVYNFFNLQSVNNDLAKENAVLKNQLLLSQTILSNNKKEILDSTLRDSVGHFRKFTLLPAAVVANSVSLQNNYLTLERGIKQGVKKGMGVICSSGIVGEVVSVSDNYALVMSVLNRNSRVSAMLKKDNIAGSVEWDGKDPAFFTLKNIPKSAKVQKGDTVFTSTYSSKFPSHVMVGIVSSIGAEASSNSYLLRIKTATNFFAVQQVYVVENVRFAEQTQLEATIPHKINE